MNAGKQLKRLLLLAGLTVAAISPAAAQDDGQTRSITSDDFAKQRPVRKGISGTIGKSPPPRRAATYKFVRRSKDVVRRKSPAGKPNKAGQPKAQKIFEVGVTMWKLRPPRASDEGFKLPVRTNDGSTQMWTAERISPDTVFRAGDRVRFAVESSSPGYLYLINSEIYTDGEIGAPSVIFPSSGEDNSVKPGLLVDIPDRTDKFPYFVIEPKNDRYAGELVTVIISPKPLINLKIGKDGRITNLDELIKLEINADVEVYSRDDARDEIYTPAEAEAACGSKTRELVREKSNAGPCGAKTRQLTREEPLPQSIYRVKTQTGMPVVSFIRLQVEN